MIDAKVQHIREASVAYRVNVPTDTAARQKSVFGLQTSIDALKSKLQATDYKAIKYAEGELSAEEYAETLEQRRAWRAEINALEAEILAIKEEDKT